MRVTEKEDDFVNKITSDLMSPSISQANALLTFLSCNASKIEQKEKDMLELTLNYCYKMQNMIKTYELINKFDGKRTVKKYEYIDLYKISNNILKDYKIIYKYNNLKTIFSGEKPYLVYADRSMTEKALEIILRESIYTSRKNSAIEISCKNIKNETEFVVKNKCSYMEFDILKKYKSTHNFKEKNYAPGYYLVKEYVLAHFGTIIAETHPDNTHIFGFKIPKK